MEAETTFDVVERVGEILQEMTERIDQDTLSELLEQYGEALEAVRTFVEAVVEMEKPIIENVFQACRMIYERLQRYQMYANLTWMPDKVAWMLSQYWPRRWLPELELNKRYQPMISASCPRCGGDGDWEVWPDGIMDYHCSECGFEDMD